MTRPSAPGPRPCPVQGLHASRADRTGTGPLPGRAVQYEEGHMAEQSHSTAASARDVLREVPLSRIVVPEGFNPRGEVADDAELEALAETIRQRGVLQPV